MIMAAASYLKENPTPTEEDVRESLEGNLCRCTGYQNIVKSILDAAGSDEPARRPEGVADGDHRAVHRRAGPAQGGSGARHRAGQLRRQPDMPGMVWMAMVRPPYVHATINSIDTSAAKSMPGVVGVFTAADLRRSGAVAVRLAHHGGHQDPRRTTR